MLAIVIHGQWLNLHIEINFRSFIILLHFYTKFLYLQRNEKLFIEAIVSKQKQGRGTALSS